MIPLPDIVVSALHEHQKRQDDERAAAVERWEDTGFVFATRQGPPMSPCTLVKYWHDVQAAAGPARRPRERWSQRHQIKVTMMVYAQGNLTEKTAALTQLGEAIQDQIDTNQSADK